MTLYQQAQKELQRIRRSISRIEKRGYVFDLPPKFKGYTKFGEKKLKWSKKEVESLRRTKAKHLYQYATYTTESGKSVKGSVGRQLERSKAATKAAKTKKARIQYYSESNIIVPQTPVSDNKQEPNGQQIKKETTKSRYDRTRSMVSQMIIDNFLDAKKFNQSPLANEVYEKVQEFLNSMLLNHSKNYVADKIQEAANDGLIQDIQHAYNWEIDIMLSGFANYFGEELEAEDNGIDEPELEEEYQTRWEI